MSITLNSKIGDRHDVNCATINCDVHNITYKSSVKNVYECLDLGGSADYHIRSNVSDRLWEHTFDFAWVYLINSPKNQLNRDMDCDDYY